MKLARGARALSNECFLDCSCLRRGNSQSTLDGMSVSLHKLYLSRVGTYYSRLFVNRWSRIHVLPWSNIYYSSLARSQHHQIVQVWRFPHVYMLAEHMGRLGSDADGWVLSNWRQTRRIWSHHPLRWLSSSFVIHRWYKEKIPLGSSFLLRKKS
jgi:hypothetical protein